MQRLNTQHKECMILCPEWNNHSKLEIIRIDHKQQKDLSIQTNWQDKVSACQKKALSDEEHKISIQSFSEYKPHSHVSHFTHSSSLLCNFFHALRIKYFPQKINYFLSLFLKYKVSVFFVFFFNLSFFLSGWEGPCQSRHTAPAGESRPAQFHSSPPPLALLSESSWSASEMAWSLSALWFGGMLGSHCKHAEGAGLVFQAQDAVCYPLHVAGQPDPNVPDVSARHATLWLSAMIINCPVQQQAGITAALWLQDCKANSVVANLYCKYVCVYVYT